MARGRSYPAPRRVFQWLDPLVRTEVQGISTATTLGDVSTGSETVTAFTLIRVRGTAVCRMVPNAASANMNVGLGLVIVSADAFAAGAASVPSPLDDLDFSWYWHHIFTFAPAVGTEVVDELGGTQSIEIDCKAQRKLTAGDTLCFVWDGQILAGGPTADGSAAIRSLGMLS